MRIVFMGTPEFAVSPLECLIFSHYSVVAVYTQPDKKAGRGRSITFSPVKRVAEKWGLSVLQPINFKESGVVKQLMDLHPDVIVVAAFGQILPQTVLDIPRYGCINIHPSLLPKFRGASPVTAAILAGDEFTGVSLMLMNKGLDTGPVLVRAQVPVSARDTTGSLMTKLSRIGGQLLLEVLPARLKGGVTPRTQDEAQATLSRVLSKADGEVDWHLSAIELWRRVRALQPWPGCYTLWQGRQLKVMEAVPLPADRTAKVGQVVALDRKDTAFGVNTGDGVLGIMMVQPEGKRAMPAADFLRGQRQFIGEVLPS